MKLYSNKISLNKNSRGIWDLDTTKGCANGMADNSRGCYGACYSAHFAKVRGYDFTQTIKRDFKNTKHIIETINRIEKPDIAFIRIGNSGDPSEDWEHTINICRIVSMARKPIVILTKHWQIIPNKLLNIIEKMDICINTSVSALDDKQQLKHRLAQYKRLKSVCNSVLRIVSCDFNKETLLGLWLSETQNILFKNDKVIDNILRVNLNHPLVLNDVIKIKKVKFLTIETYASIYNKHTYFGHCSMCPDMCGINI